MDTCFAKIGMPTPKLKICMAHCSQTVYISEMVTKPVNWL